MDRYWQWQEVVGMVGMFALIITIVVVTVTQIGSVRRAKARAARDDEQRRLAEESLASLRNVERQLTELSGQLTEMRTRMDSVERILQQVE
jgi:type VI protein secretion system component VasK